MSVPTRRLTEEQFHATFPEPMRNITDSVEEVLDIWPYVESVPASDLAGHSVYDGTVEAAYRSADERFDHVLVWTRTANVYLIVVVDVQADEVNGHYLLDLNREYGLS